jgi:hypothetical protein
MTDPAYPTQKLPDPQILGMLVSECIFRLYGFGPSQSLCQPFAEQVIAEATRVGATRVIELSPGLYDMPARFPHPEESP